VVALVAACVRPLIQAVLCAPSARVGAAEWRRASLLLYDSPRARPGRLSALSVSCRTRVHQF
jgi:hypothetical protein